MNITYVSSTDLKRHISDIVNTVYYEKSTAIVERHGKPMVKITPIEEKTTGSIKSLKDYFGILPDFPDVSSSRRFERKVPAL